MEVSCRHHQNNLLLQSTIKHVHHHHRHRRRHIERIALPTGARLRGRGRRRLCVEMNKSPAPVQAGGKMVVELVGAFNELTHRMDLLSTSSSLVLFNTLKLSIPILLSLPLSLDGRSPLSRALSIATILADLQMDAEVISAGLLIHLFESRQISIFSVTQHLGTGIAHLLHQSLRLDNFASKVELLDDDTAAALRKFYLTYYDIRALVLDLALKLDIMRHLEPLPRYQQQLLALRVMKIHVPLAHAVGTNLLSLQLEDLSFRYLFPSSYFYLDTWLTSHQTTGTRPLLDIYKECLAQSLKADPFFADMVDNVSVYGRYKSRYSTMKKLLRDGRQPDQVNDVLGLRVILTPNSASSDPEAGAQACYRAREVIKSLWKEMPHRTKDYISNPKANGYKSLHMAVDVSEDGMSRPLMEIQIRTREMDVLADAGSASHSLYKGGLTDPEEAKRLKAVITAAAEVAALRLRDIPSSNERGNNETTDQRDKVFSLLDKNGDGRISIGELMEVMEELGAPGDDACEMMNLIDSNSDGSLSSEEFDSFQKQVEFMRSLDDRDDEYKSMLDEKLHLADNSGLIQLYRKELGSRLSTS